MKQRFDYTSDACDEFPCQGPNTLCVPKTVSEYSCICESGYEQINGSAKEFGCEMEKIISIYIIVFLA